MRQGYLFNDPLQHVSRKDHARCTERTITKLRFADDIDASVEEAPDESLDKPTESMYMMEINAKKTTGY